MRAWLLTASLMGALAVICGAFAAHGLQGRLDSDARQIFETGARYHMYHALAMGLSAFAMRGEAISRARWAAMLFLAGSVLFSGSLYLLALSGNVAFAYVTPVGGFAFIAGWIMLGLAALKQP